MDPRRWVQDTWDTMRSMNTREMVSQVINLGEGKGVATRCIVD